jgi:TPR repeat protein
MAVRHLENAAAKENTALAQYHLGMAYLQSSDKRGRSTLEAALRMDAKLPEAEEAQRLLARAGKTQ